MNTERAIAIARRCLESGELERAAELYRRILSSQPDHVEALHLLGVLHIQRQEYEPAVELIRSAVARDGVNADMCANLALALRGAGELDEALLACDRALVLDPAHANAYYNRGAMLKTRGRLPEAIASLRHCVALMPEAADVRANLAALLLEAGAVDEALGCCEECLALDGGNRLATGYKAMALDRLGRRAAVRELMDLGLVWGLRMDAPPAYADVAAFNGALAAHVQSHPSLKPDHTGKATRHGSQTTELLVEPKGPIADLERIIHRAVAAYLEEIPYKPSHPYLGRRPHRWELTVWGVVLGAQGYQEAHMHGDGWVSGVYYVSVPVEVAQRPAGWIEFGRPPKALQPAPEPEVRLFEPREGLMLLFPSYMHHRTIPFDSDRPRISIAFDAIPLPAG